jgi:ubiquinone/menaquinone biosynthesis C-methylase UbiE
MTNTNPSLDYFEQVAGQWDKLRTGYFRENVRDAAIAKAYLHPKMTVADVGAGTGFMAAGLAPLAEKVHLLDGSPAMLEVARKNLAQFENLEFHTADGIALPLPDSSLDAVFANMYLHHAPDPLAAIREMVRILRPGGRLVITDMDAHTHEWLKTEMADLWLGFKREQIRGWYEQAGLVNVIVDSTGESCQSDLNTVPVSSRESDAGEHADISIFVAAGTKHIAARDSVQANYTARAEAEGCGCDSECCAPDTASREESGCCNSGCCSTSIISLDNIASVHWDGGYTSTDKAEIPAEAAEISLGCGNPTAMANLREG